MKQYSYYGDYTLTLKDTGQKGEYGKARVAYCLEDENGVIFEGEDLEVARRGEDIEGPRTAGDLLSFLTLRKGDIEDEYFANDTPRQAAFRENEAEELSLWGYDLEEGVTCENLQSSD